MGDHTSQQALFAPPANWPYCREKVRVHSLFRAESTFVALSVGCRHFAAALIAAVCWPQLAPSVAQANAVTGRLPPTAQSGTPHQQVSQRVLLTMQLPALRGAAPVELPIGFVSRKVAIGNLEKGRLTLRRYWQSARRVWNRAERRLVQVPFAVPLVVEQPFAVERLSKLLLTASLRPDLLFQRDPLCSYCATPITRANATIDHHLPLALNGKDTWTNLVAACRPCNADKADLHPDHFGDLIWTPYAPTNAHLIAWTISGADAPFWLQHLNIGGDWGHERYEETQQPRHRWDYARLLAERTGDPIVRVIFRSIADALNAEQLPERERARPGFSAMIHRAERLAEVLEKREPIPEVTGAKTARASARRPDASEAPSRPIPYEATPIPFFGFPAAN